MAGYARRISDCSSDVCSSDLAPSQQARDYVLGTGQLRQRATLDNGGLSLRGEPFETWAGPVSFALGIEGRRETVRQTAGDLDRAKAVSFNNFPELRGANTTKEAFGERSEEHTSELQSLMRISYAGFCLNKNNK